MKTRWFSGTTPLAATLTGMLLLSACGGSHSESAAPAAKSPVRVATVPLAEQEWPVNLEAVGSVEARTESTIAAKVMGYVESVRVQEGDRVSAGQTLIEISAQEIREGVAQAEAGQQEAQAAMGEVESAIAAANAQAVLARTTFQRMRNLHERKSLSDQEFDEAKARLEAAEASLKMAESRKAQVGEKIRQAAVGVKTAETHVAYLRVSAPFAGVVTARMVEPGNLASPGMPLLKIEQAGNYRLVVAFPESALRHVKVGQKLDVAIDAAGVAAQGTVVEVVPISDPATRTFPVKITLPANAALRSGLYGKALLPAEPQRVLAVPVEAVQTNGQLTTVLVASDNVARSRMVKLGQEREGMRELLSGLTAGELLIVPVPAGLRDGDPVEVSR